MTEESREKRQCLNCNASFIPKTSKQKHCSKKCYQEYYRKTHREYYREYYLKNEKRLREKDKKNYQKRKEEKMRRRKIIEECVEKFNNCFSCPYQDCIQE